MILILMRTYKYSLTSFSILVAPSHCSLLCIEFLGTYSTPTLQALPILTSDLILIKGIAWLHDLNSFRLIHTSLKKGKEKKT